MREVFISYDSNDRIVADVLCEALEDAGITCWIEPRDISKNRSRVNEIADSIENCKVFLLVYSSSSSASEEIANEMELAFNSGLTIIPFIIDGTQPINEFRYFVKKENWFDASSNKFVKIKELIAKITKILFDSDCHANSGDSEELIGSYKLLTKSSREVFISYKSESTAPGSIDETVANKLCYQIEAAGITCWIAPRDIPKGRRYADEIVDAIEKCKVLLVVFSKHADKSIWISDEVRIAYENRKTICSFKIDDIAYESKWKIYLGGSQLIDARGDYHLKIPELINDLKYELGETPTSNSPILSVIPETLQSLPDPLVFTVSDVSFNMIRVNGGEFNMGATSEQGNDYRDDERPQHHVILSTFYIGEMQVTQELWQAVMGYNPSEFKGNLHCPVENVSWKDCQEFITKLNGLTGKKFRLPTEAEWEFAARGGNKSKGYKYAGSDNLDDVAWYQTMSYKKIYSVARVDTASMVIRDVSTRSVGRKKANELGLYDMSGNVWEWCQDWYDDYTNDNQNNPTGSSSGSRRVRRGGSWRHGSKYCRVSCRGHWGEDHKCDNLGLRLALDL